MHEQAQIAQGWNLVRGSLADWGFDSELKEVERMSAEVDLHGSAWLAFHRKRMDAVIFGPQLTKVQEALTLLEFRQLSLLDAVRAVHMIGRPAAGGVLLRTIYENFLAVLLLAFQEPKEEAKDTKRISGASMSKEVLARRFLDYGRLCLLESQARNHTNYGDKVLPSGTSITEVRARIALLKPQFLHAKRPLHWHAFANSGKLKDYLWPIPGKSVFPSDFLPLNEETWTSLYDANFVDKHNDVHSNAASLFLHEASRNRGGLLGADRYWQSDEFDSASTLVDLSIRAIAYAEGVHELYIAELESRNLISKP